MQKNSLSRESCKSELQRKARGNVFSAAIELLLVLLICVPLIFLGIFLLKYLPFFGIVTIVLLSVFPIICLYTFIRSVLIVRLCKRNEFSVVADTVTRLAKGEVRKKWGVGRQFQDVIYFSRHGYVAVDKTIFDLTVPGDTFYLVILHTKNEKPFLIYPSALYEYDELDQCS